MTAGKSPLAIEEAQRRRVIARLEKALKKPHAFQRLVDRLPAENAILGLKVWGAMRGLYPDCPQGEGAMTVTITDHARHRWAWQRHYGQGPRVARHAATTHMDTVAPTADQARWLDDGGATQERAEDACCHADGHAR